MSLYIDTDKVHAVLLADGWHHVLKESFYLDSYEFHYQDHLVHGGGDCDVCATGFSFLETLQGPALGDEDIQIAGPLTAILAVRYLP